MSPRNPLLTVLLQDPKFVKDKNWSVLSEAVGMGYQELPTMKEMFDTGELQVTDIVSQILTRLSLKWKEQEVAPNLARILKEQDFLYAAELIQNYIDRPAKLLTEYGRLDSGAFAEVFKMRGIMDDIDYAVKKISIQNFINLTKSPDHDGEACFDKLIREVNALKKLTDCSGVVTYHFAWFEGPLAMEYNALLENPAQSQPTGAHLIQSPLLRSGPDTYLCIKMELCDTNLEMWMKTNTNPTLSTVDNIIKQILKGLQFIHKESLIHRDLKPNNILINIRDRELIVKIGDLGLSRQITFDAKLSKCVGAPLYQSPEMKFGEDYDKLTDIFSLGLIYLGLLYPLTIKVVDSVQHGDLNVIADLEQIHDQDFNLLRKMLSKTTKDRLNSDEALELMTNPINN